MRCVSVVVPGGVVLAGALLASGCVTVHPSSRASADIGDMVAGQPVQTSSVERVTNVSYFDLATWVRGSGMPL